MQSSLAWQEDASDDVVNKYTYCSRQPSVIMAEEDGATALAAELDYVREKIGPDGGTRLMAAVDEAKMYGLDLLNSCMEVLNRAHRNASVPREQLYATLWATNSQEEDVVDKLFAAMHNEKHKLDKVDLLVSAFAQICAMSDLSLGGVPPRRFNNYFVKADEAEDGEDNTENKEDEGRNNTLMAFLSTAMDIYPTPAETVLSAARVCRKHSAPPSTNDVDAETHFIKTSLLAIILNSRNWAGWLEPLMSFIAPQDRDRFEREFRERQQQKSDRRYAARRAQEKQGRTIPAAATVALAGLPPPPAPAADVLLVLEGADDGQEEARVHVAAAEWSAMLQGVPRYLRCVHHSAPGTAHQRLDVPAMMGAAGSKWVRLTSLGFDPAGAARNVAVEVDRIPQRPPKPGRVVRFQYQPKDPTVLLASADDLVERGGALDAGARDAAGAHLVAQEPDVLPAIRGYTKAGFINSVLRDRNSANGRRHDYMDHLEVLDRAFQQAALTTAPITLYRGFEVKDVPLDAMFGHQSAFVSASETKEAACRFAETHLMKITVPAGIPVIYLSSVSTHKNEEEVLLPRGTVLTRQGSCAEKGDCGPSIITCEAVASLAQDAAERISSAGNVVPCLDVRPVRAVKIGNGPPILTVEQVSQYLHEAFRGIEGCRVREPGSLAEERFFKFFINPSDYDAVYNFLVELYKPDGKNVEPITCLALSVTYNDDPDNDDPDDDRPIVHLHNLFRCGPNSGAQLLRRLDVFAASIDARVTELVDSSDIELKPPAVRDRGRKVVYKISYSDFLVLATGQTYYNQFGYRIGNHEADVAHNAALIDRPFGATFRELARKLKTKAEATGDRNLKYNLPAWTQIVLGSGSESPPFLRGLSYDDSTRAIFSMLRRENVLHTLAGDDPLAFWIDAVIKVFRNADGGIAGADDRSMFKRYPRSTAADVVRPVRAVGIGEGGQPPLRVSAMQATVRQYLRAAFRGAEGYRIRESGDGSFSSDDEADFTNLTNNNEIVYDFLVEYNPNGKRARPMSCLALSVSYMVRGDRPIIHLRTLSRCGPNSGAKLLRRLDVFAASINARETQLGDASRFHLQPPTHGDFAKTVSSIHYSEFLVLATGQTYYNQFGYRGSNHEAVVAHNAALIDRPFGATFRELARKLKAKAEADSDQYLERRMQVWTQIVLGSDSESPPFLRGLSYDDSTRAIFSMLHRENVLHTLAGDDPLALWIDAVIMVFMKADGGIASSGRMVKQYQPSTAAVTGGGRRWRRAVSQRTKKRGAASRAGRTVRARRI